MQTERVFSNGGSIGRAAACELVLPDADNYISSEHAIVERRPDGFFLIDRSAGGRYDRPP